MTTSELGAAYTAIRDAHADGTIRRFRAKYAGECFICGHRFRVPVEMVAKVAPGKCACLACEQTALLPTVAEQRAAEQEERDRNHALAEQIRAEVLAEIAATKA